MSPHACLPSIPAVGCCFSESSALSSCRHVPTSTCMTHRGSRVRMSSIVCCYCRIQAFSSSFFFNFHIFFLTHSKCVETLAVLCLPTIGGKKNLYEPTHRSSPPGLLPFVPNAAVSLRSLISGVLLDWLPITKFSLHYSFIWSAHSRVTTWSVQWWRGSIIRHTNNR